jgi:hypothetical protein
MNLTLRCLCLGLLTIAAALISSCGGGGGGGSSTPPVTFTCTPPSGSNSVVLAVDAGPTGANGAPIANVVNQSYVTINVYVPSKGSCQTIDHVWVDTGSVGLRLFRSAFTDTLPLPQVSGNAVANCAQFVLGFSWGAVRTADVKIGGETAASVPIQIIGDTAVPATAPASCSSGTGGASNGLTTAAKMGANGMLGIGVFRCPVSTTPVPAAPVRRSACR